MYLDSVFVYLSLHLNFGFYLLLIFSQAWETMAYVLSTVYGFVSHECGNDSQCFQGAHNNIINNNSIHNNINNNRNIKKNI